MAQYRKRPIVIEAFQWEVRMGEKGGVRVVYKWNQTGEPRFVVDTLEGPLVVLPGDWIITGVKGERYPIKDEIFRMTYEPVGADESESDDS